MHMIAHKLEARDNASDLWRTLPAALVETLLYGTHLVLFGICTYVLVRKRSRAGVVVLLSLVIMIGLATADVALTFRVIVNDIPAFLRSGTPGDLRNHLRLKSILFVTDNSIGDGLLLYRCFMVWKGHRFDKIIALVVSALLTVDTIWGYLAAATDGLDFERAITPLYLWSVFAFNISITAITAGRIWWLARLSRLLGKQSVRSYNITIAILIESGAIYSISVMLLLILWNKPYTVVLVAIVLRIVGVVPALMIVQVELGARGHQADRYSVEMTTNPMFTTVAVSSNSTQVFTEGLDSDVALEGHLPRDTKATLTLPIPMRNRNPPELNV